MTAFKSNFVAVHTLPSRRRSARRHWPPFGHA
jgi:hypothetical protein